MRLEFQVELPDAPGELSRVLNIVARFGGNVMSVIHRHERALEGKVPVDVAIEVPEPASLKLLDALAQSHRLLRVNRQGGPARSAVLLLGHVFESGLTPVMDAVFAAGGDVGQVDARISGRQNPSAVLLRVTADRPEVLAKCLAALQAKASEEGLGVITQAGGEWDE